MDVAHATRPAPTPHKTAPAITFDETPLAPSAPRPKAVQRALRDLLARDPELSSLGGEASLNPPAGFADYIVAFNDEPHQPDEIFDRLRWGGQFVYLNFDRAQIDSLRDAYGGHGFEVSDRLESVRTGALRWIPFLGRRLWYFTARKLYLVRPREITERFTYHVQLSRPPAGANWPDSFVVMKEVPTLERVVGRLRAKFTDVPLNVVEKRAMKFTEKIFPLFLTREAAMLKILQRDLPKAYHARVPTLLEVEKDDRGYVRRMWMNWLRNGGQSLTQLEFAKQSADLLRVVHDHAHVMHLDLRLDNFVLTPAGVGFVDFGSAVRMGENIRGNPLLSTLFDELMRTSQIQRMLHKMTSTGTVTSQLIHEAYGRVDKQVDLFYLAVQISQPLHNPDLVGLVRYDPSSREAHALSQLTQDILKPADPQNPRYRTAADVLGGIRHIELALRKG